MHKYSRQDIYNDVTLLLAAATMGSIRGRHPIVHPSFVEIHSVVFV